MRLVPTLSEDLVAVTGRVSREQAHEGITAAAVARELHGDIGVFVDDVIDWAAEHQANLSAGLVDLRAARLAEEQQRRHDMQRLRESQAHYMAAVHTDPCARCRELGVCQRADCGGPSSSIMPASRSSRVLHSLWRWLRGLGFGFFG